MELKNTHIPHGFVIGLAMVVIGLIEYVTGMAFKSGFQYIAYIPFLAGLILNARAFAKANDGFVTFGNVFGSGFKATMIVTIVMVAWALTTLLIFPEMKTKALEMSREQMAKNPKMTDEQLDAALKITMKFWNTIVVASSILGTMFFGAIFSLIAAGAVPKKGPKPIGDVF